MLITTTTNFAEEPESVTSPLSVDERSSREFYALAQDHLGPVTTVSVDEVHRGDTPRMGSQDARHAAILADIERELPPIIVHRETMRIIDGTHRLSAAKQRGIRTITARFFTGNAADAFVLSVRANTTHGKPLNLTERRRAATRILRSHPNSSDRAIAEVCGLSAGTVATLRRATVESPQMNKPRVGRDGRVRPLDTTAARRQAAILMREDPDLSLREVARATGLSPGTVRDVRQRISSGRPPELIHPLPPSEALTDAEDRKPVGYDDLQQDSALQATPEGREFLEWLGTRAIADDEWRPFVEAVPKSRVYLVAEAARRFASTWSDFADSLEGLFRRGRGAGRL